MAQKPSTCSLVCPIQAKQLWFPAYIQIDVLMGPRIVIIILTSTRLFMSFAHLEKSSYLLFRVNSLKVMTSPTFPSRAICLATYKAQELKKQPDFQEWFPVLLAKSLGSKLIHSFLLKEKQTLSGSPRRVVGKRNASPFSRGAISSPWRSGLSHFLTIHQHSSSTAPARFSSLGRLKCSFWINNSFQLWYLHLRVPEEQSVFKRKWEKACSRGALCWREKSCNSQKCMWMNENDFLWLMSPKH